MRRREFILALGAATAWPLTVHAQHPERVRRVGVLMTTAESDQEEKDYIRAFLQELRALGWEQGRNVQIEFRWGGSDADRIKAHAAELVSLNPDVILAQSTPAVVAMREATRTIPTIFVAVSDPAFVENLARPSGNATGLTNFESSMGGKWLEVLKEMAPRTAEATAIYNPTTSPHIAAGRYLLPLKDTAGRLIIRVTIFLRSTARPTSSKR
jgi:putative tryptophan/tyrosine transport system substrate-binding protein